MTRHDHDILNTLAEIAPGSELAQARHTRKAATRHSEGSYRALFTDIDESNALPLSLRLWLAESISAWHQDSPLQRFYAQRRKEFPAPPPTPAIDAALAHAERLTRDPVGSASADLQALLTAGWTPDSIVTLSQITAFVSFQSRLLRGLRLLAGHTVDIPPPRDATAGRWHTQAHTLSGQRAPQAFTQAELGWEPWIAPKALNEFNADEQALLARFGHSDSDYFRLLARDLPVLEQRTLTDKGIFYTSGGLPRAERELAAAVVSKVNGCIFCASVHARKASQLAKQHDAVQRLLDTAAGADLAQGQDPRWQAIITFAARLSTTPAQVDKHALARLHEQGLTTLEILDLVQSAAFFAWANRLMLTLGEPFWPEH
ncbi:alkylhydroperoxidase domain protein [Brenneria goodwinii]|uniref:Alkylhydroperoxidase domain protein n=1 Tax=Brenneria goodwinii TaxID=1109412 RepID=A0AAE8ENJ5_9GAMM|nr:alkylhydroperoxidase domain protein [Brenneria goodwinii]ATA23716.1 alkylhydroperoxidase [Brenneria goodwinii]RLM18482.1 alkylhydroperoxidase domain protein [Brenneria goodwinii]